MYCRCMFSIVTYRVVLCTLATANVSVVVVPNLSLLLITWRFLELVLYKFLTTDLTSTRTVQLEGPNTNITNANV